MVIIWIRRPVQRASCVVVIIAGRNLFINKNEFKSRYLFSPQTPPLLVFIMGYCVQYSFGAFTRTMSSTLHAEYIIIITTRILEFRIHRGQNLRFAIVFFVRFLSLSA